MRYKKKCKMSVVDFRSELSDKAVIINGSDIVPIQSPSHLKSIMSDISKTGIYGSFSIKLNGYSLGD